MIHGLSFNIEEHFQVTAFDSGARRRNWENLESRVEYNTQVILDLLEERGIKATMFVLGWVADRKKELVKRIVEAGHELASNGYAHELISAQSPQTFREDVRRTKNILEDIGGKPVLGYRAPTLSFIQGTEWALPILVEEGYHYDSSIVPIVHDFSGIPDANPWIHQLNTSSGQLWEIPPSTCQIAVFKIFVAGGGYIRLLPYSLLLRLLRRVESQGHPLILYLAPWELDTEQPRMKGSLLSQFRHYVNLDKVQTRLTQLLTDFSFGSCQSLLPHSS